MSTGLPFDRAVQALSQARVVAIACHVNPDADAIGSMLGLSNHLRARGTSTVCSFPNDPFDVPRWAATLPGREALVPPREFPKEPQMMVTCDTASMDRLSMLAASAVRAEVLIWIDHHVSNEGLGTIPLIDGRASSTAEIVWRLLRGIGGEIPVESAACLYAGLVTDTGRFQYEAVRPDTLRLGAELREFPFEHTRLVQALYEDNTTAYLRVLGVALERISVEPDADLVWCYLTRSDLLEAGIHPSETDDLIDVVRTAREGDVTAVIKQQRDGRFKVSLRSKGDHDVAAVAAHFGGGGHRLAAGYTSEHGLPDTVERLKAALMGRPVEP
ncbi:MAG TPA: bifunctional oligoribonuclease/PAP phosphatase NrnA [Actinomycetota bacterium]|nr:bifunctional oligoribonuclease/PAP phosphatase NrnA [Actinomycetota bacterium]